jgi:regulator of sigma E protease
MPIGRNGVTVKDMTVASYLLAILGLAALMVVHEGGHFFAARRYGMRVTKFSIGFGPTLWKHRPKDSWTTYQVAIIPFLAYVQIAGMNPYEDQDPNDKGSYANASLWARVATIAAGPVANYLFASVFLFFGFMLSGNPVQDGMRVNVAPDGPAAKAGIIDGDAIVAVNVERVNDWDNLKRLVGAHPGEAIDLEIQRKGETLHVKPTPTAGGDTKGKILIGPKHKIVKVGVAEAALLSVKEPPMVVYQLLKGLVRFFTGKEKPEFTSVVGITREVAAAVRSGTGDAFKLLGMISAYLAGFNLLPFPALDGGRLLFLGFEAASKKRADAKIEAKIHAVGLLMFLTLIAFVTYGELVPKK